MADIRVSPHIVAAGDLLEECAETCPSACAQLIARSLGVTGHERLTMNSENAAPSAPVDAVVMPDSRFFDGYVWCSDDPECRTGLCMKAASREDAAEKYVSKRRRYWNKDKRHTVWTMLNASDTPKPVEA